MELADFKLSLWNWVVIFFKGKFGGGITSVIEYVLNLFNDRFLSKISPEKLKKHSGAIVALAEFCEKLMNIYILDEVKKSALCKTVATLKKLAVALEDGKVTAEELEDAINDVVAVIKSWKDICKCRIYLKAENKRGEEVEVFIPCEA